MTVMTLAIGALLEDWLETSLLQLAAIASHFLLPVTH